MQSTRRQAERNGNALGPLFQRVSPDVFRRPTYGLFVALLDNYKSALSAQSRFDKYQLSCGGRQILFTPFKRSNGACNAMSVRAHVGETGAAESFGARERQEMSDFLDACMQSAPLQYVHRLLIEKVRAPLDGSRRRAQHTLAH